MARAVRLFISSSPDLTSEREALGRAVAALPVSVGWEIKHTPRVGEDALEAAEFIERADFIVCALGADFAAPMGYEWSRAPSVGATVLAYAKRELQSPSAQAALREGALTPQPFASPAELAALVTRKLVRGLLDGSARFGLELAEIEPLLKLAGAEEGADQQPPDEERRGAERGGVILGRGTFE